jgi:tetratricopeptide (TPR) repeat protein
MFRTLWNRIAVSPTTGKAPTPRTECLRDGMALFAQGDLHGALFAFREAARFNPASHEAWNNCGFVRLSLGGSAEALEDFTRALTLHPDYAEAWNNRGRARQALGDAEGAMADFERALSCATGRFLATVHHNRGALRQEMGDLMGALADYDHALEAAPEHVATHVNRGIARKEAGDLQGALADLDRAVETMPRSAMAYHARGGVRVLLNDFPGAIADYDEAIRLDPGYAVAYISRGNASYHRRDRRRVSDYLTAFRLNPEGAARELVRVLVEGVQRDAAEVLDNCDRHLRLSDWDVLAHARLGLTLVLLGREAAAAPHLACFRDLVPAGAAHFDRLLQQARTLVHAHGAPSPCIGSS